MPIVWDNVRNLGEIIITYSIDQKIDLTYLWKKLRYSVKFKSSGINMIDNRNKCQWISFLTG